MTGMECGQSCLGLLVLPLVDNYQDHHIKIKTHSVAFAHEFVCFVVKLNFCRICDLKNICSMTHKTPQNWWHSLLAQDHYRLDLESRRNVVRLSYQLALDRWKARVYLICIVGIPTLTWKNLILCIVLDVALLHWYMCPLFLVQNSHHAWQKQQHRLNILWQQWRLEIQALGKAQQEHWPPPPPPHIEPPAELFKVDTK